MLVATFQIQVRRPLQIRPTSTFKDKGMRAARIKPHVENVGYTLIICQCVIRPKIFLRPFLGPAIDTLCAHAGNDAGIHGRVVEILVGPLFYKQGDRYAPCALTGQHPVRAAFDHRRQPVAALFGDEAGVRNRGHCFFPQCGANCRLIHRHEPLRGAAIDDLRL